MSKKLKTYNVEVKALKTAQTVNLQINLLKNGEKINGITKSAETNLKIILTDYNYYNYSMSLSTEEVLDLKEYDTSQVTKMPGMFFGCKNLVSIDISSLDTTHVTNMGRMFAECPNLTKIDGIIDMQSCTAYSSMFVHCSKLTGVKIKNPPADFTTHDETTGLNTAGLRADQYEIVE